MNDEQQAEIDKDAEVEEVLHPRYVDAPVVHLEQVIYCARCHFDGKVGEALTIFGGEAICSDHLKTVYELLD